MRIGVITTTRSGHTVLWASGHRHLKSCYRALGNEQWKQAKWPLGLTQHPDQLTRTGQPCLTRRNEFGVSASQRSVDDFKCQPGMPFKPGDESVAESGGRRPEAAGNV